MSPTNVSPTNVGQTNVGQTLPAHEVASASSVAPSATLASAGGTPSFTLAFWVALLALALALVSLTMAWRARAPAPLATIDLTSIVAQKEREFTALLAKPDVTDAQREQAYDLVKAIGPQIDAALKSLRTECRCILLTKGAVLASDDAEVPDLTSLLKPKLGLQP